MNNKFSDEVRGCRKDSRERVLPFIWTHPPVEHAHGSVTQTGNDERTLGIAGKAGHTAVCSCWDVLVDTHKHTKRFVTKAYQGATVITSLISQ